MKLTLIGMSGSGKSYWSRSLETAGFTRFGCDDQITIRLAEELKYDAHNFPMHQWVGYPDEEGYEERSAAYLSAEQAVLDEILRTLQDSSADENIVIDATGSIIYMPMELLKRLREETQIILLEVTRQDYKNMLAFYLANPTAIIWQGLFQPNQGESRLQTFERCYPRLIQSRKKAYQCLADLTIPTRFHRAPSLSAADFVNLIKSNKFQS